MARRGRPACSACRPCSGSGPEGQGTRTISMFGKRTTFGGNTPGVAQPPRPVESPAPAAAAAVQRRAGDDDAMAARMRTTDEVLDVRDPAEAQRAREYFQPK